MEKARAAVAEFTGRRGHTTDVIEEVAPAVVREHVKPVRHEEVQEAIDREVHQDHYHTTVQPIQHQEVLPEQHHHQMKDVVHKEFRHGDDHETRLRLEREAGQFKNVTHTHETKVTTAAAPVVEGEHVHHHVHEIVQPIIHKETITPEVVHTTVPIHEHHHASAQHHGISHLPMKTLSEFESAGGILKGGKTSSHETYEGAPRPYNRELMKNPTDADLNPSGTGLGGEGDAHHLGGTGASTGSSGLGQRDSGYAGSGRNTTAGPHSSNMANKADPRVDSDLDGSRGLGRNTGTSNTGYNQGSTGSRLENDLEGNRGVGRNTGSSNTGYNQGSTGSRLENDLEGNRGLGNNSGSTGYNQGSTGNAGSRLEGSNASGYDDTTTQHKPSMMDRLNPLKKTSS